jgi:penicillin V acylase-like amidase (Ntn superfamily)
MCTRIFNNRNTSLSGESSFSSTARNFDWETQLPTDLFAFRKGLKKTSTTDQSVSSFDWVSEYSSVVIMIGSGDAGYACGDGINSEGLVINALYDTGADNSRSAPALFNISALRFGQYLLDCFSNVADVVAKLEKNDIWVMPGKIPASDHMGTVHFSLSDKKGDSLIVEFGGDKLVLFHDRKNRIMSNQPGYQTQQQLNAYWLWQGDERNPNQSHSVPGGCFSADRFERATYYLNGMISPKDMQTSLAQAKSVAYACSVPVGFERKTLNAEPNTASTNWTGVSYHDEPSYYFLNVLASSAIWLRLAELSKSNFATAPVWKLSLIKVMNNTSTHPEYVGDVAGLMSQASDPFCCSL